MKTANSKPSKADLLFASVYNDKAKFPSTSHVAAKLSMAVQSVKNRATELRKLALKNKKFPAIISRVIHADVPFSEDESRFEKDFLAEDCIAELRRIVEAFPDQVISRNFFRVHSTISESTWNRHFGTFLEFKRQANIILSRSQHKHERNIAKHASVDHYRALSSERLDWGEKYLRPTDKRFQMGLFCSDLHDKEIDPFYLRVLLDVAKRAQPDLVSFVGDVYDLPEFGKYAIDPREWDPVGRIRFANDNIMRPMREAVPNAQIDVIEGNHEFRLLRHMADATPALKAVLADLHGMTVQKFFKLDELEINWVGKADFAVYTEKDLQNELKNNYRVYWDCFLAHHFPDARSMGMPGVNGHHHSHQVWSMFNPIFGAYEWHQMGAGHKRDASYCKGEKWHNGFTLVHCDTKTKSVNFEYVPISDFASVGGKLYIREEYEVCARPRILAPILA